MLFEFVSLFISVNGEQQIRFCKNQEDKKSCFKIFNNDPDANSNDLHTKKTNTDLKQCAPEYAGCEYKFYYEKKIESVNYYNADQDDNDEVFIFFRQKDIEDTNENEWVPQIKCSEIPMAELIGAAGGEDGQINSRKWKKNSLLEIKFFFII